MSMLFISHSTKDKAAAEDLHYRLIQRGYDLPFLDSDAESGIAAGTRWQQVLYERLKDCRALLVLCSKHWAESKWCFAELVYAKSMGKEVFPILLEDWDPGPELGEHQGILIYKEGDAVWDRLWRALEDRHLGPQDDFGWPVDRCPYPGFPAFDEDYAGVFFGRETETRGVLETLNTMRSRGQPRFLLIIGGSGCGKSSLLRAGVLPRLKRKATDEWLVLSTLRYSESAGGGLTLSDRLAREIADRFPDQGRPDWKALRDDFAQEDTATAAKAFLDATLDLTSALGGPQATTVLAIDQFEELLTPTAGEDAKRFLRFLHAVFSGSNNQLLGVGTLRSDHLDQYQRHPCALQSPSLKISPLELLPRERLTDVIRRPAERTHVEFSNELVARLQEDAPTSDALPLLAFALEKLYRRRGNDGKIELAEYEDMGCLDGAIKQTVEGIWQEISLTPETERALRLSFVRHLSQVNESDQVVRCRASWSELPKPARPVLERFINERLLISDEHEERTVELAHEALFRCWDDLKNWLRDSKVVLAWRRDVERDRTTAAQHGTPWRGLTHAQREIAHRWPRERPDELHDQEKTWIKQASRRQIVFRSVITAVVLLVASLAAYSIWQRNETESARADAVDNLAQAQTNHRRTTAHRLALTAEGLIDQDPQLGILLAAEGIRVTQRAAEDTVVEARDTLARLLGRFMARPLAQELAGSNYAAFTPDGSSIVFADDTSVSIMELDPSGLTQSIVSIPWSEGMIQHTFGPVGAWFMAQSQSEEGRKTNNYVINMTSKEATNVETRPHSLSVDGRWLIVVDEQRAVHLVGTQMSTADLSGIQVGEHWGNLRDLVLSEDGLWLAMLDRDLSPLLVDLSKHADGEADVLQSLSESRGINFLQFSRNGRWLAAADTDDELSVSGAKIDLWRLDDNTWRVAGDKSDFFGGGIALLEVSPHGNWMGIVGWEAGDMGDNNDFVSLWHLGDKEFRRQLPLRAEVSHIAFSSDDRWIAAASHFDSTVRVWDLTDYAEAKRDGRQLRKFLEFDVEGRGVSSLRFLQSRNSLLVLAGRPQIWHLDVGNPPEEPVDFLGRQIDPGKFVFSPNKDWMVTLDDDGLPWLWMFEKPSSGAEVRYSEIGEKELLGLAAQVAGRNLTQAEWSTYFGEGEADASPDQTFEEFGDLAPEN